MRARSLADADSGHRIRSRSIQVYVASTASTVVRISGVLDAGNAVTDALSSKQRRRPQLLKPICLEAKKFLSSPLEQHLSLRPIIIQVTTGIIALTFRDKTCRLNNRLKPFLLVISFYFFILSVSISFASLFIGKLLDTVSDYSILLLNYSLIVHPIVLLPVKLFTIISFFSFLL